MATVVPFASCYARNSIGDHPLLFETYPGRNQMFPYRSPRWAPRPHLVYGPRMTIRQICRLLRTMRREAAAATGVGRKVAPMPVPSSPNIKAERRCFPCCLRRRRSKRVG